MEVRSVPEVQGWNWAELHIQEAAIRREVACRTSCQVQASPTVQGWTGDWSDVAVSKEAAKDRASVSSGHSGEVPKRKAQGMPG